MARKLPLYVVLARSVAWRKQTNEAFRDQADRRLKALEDFLPSGSGIDSGTKIDLEGSTADRLVLLTSFHHMNETGFYDGWTEHKITVRPSLAHGFNLKVGGRDRRQIKDYLGDIFHETLSQEVPEYPEIDETAETVPTVGKGA